MHLCCHFGVFDTSHKLPPKNNLFILIPTGLCIAGFEIEKQKKKFSLKDIWDNGFLWGVPKHRRPIEKRLSRKFGWPKYDWKPLVPKTNLVMCRKCGHHHEAYTICGII